MKYESKMKLPKERHNELLSILQNPFEKNKTRHKNIEMNLFSMTAPPKAQKNAGAFVMITKH